MKADHGILALPGESSWLRLPAPLPLEDWWGVLGKDSHETSRKHVSIDGQVVRDESTDHYRLQIFYLHMATLGGEPRGRLWHDVLALPHIILTLEGGSKVSRTAGVDAATTVPTDIMSEEWQRDSRKGGKDRWLVTLAREGKILSLVARVSEHNASAPDDWGEVSAQLLLDNRLLLSGGR